MIHISIGDLLLTDDGTGYTVADEPTIDLEERIEPYYTVDLDELDRRTEPYANAAPYTVGPAMDSATRELFDTKLRLIAAILDRQGVCPTVKADALTEIARLRELIA